MEQAAVNRKVEGSNPFSGASEKKSILTSFFYVVTKDLNIRFVSSGGK